MATKQWKRENHERILEYQREYQREWYKRNIDHVRPKIYERRETIRQWLNDYKAGLACSKCGENHPACLEFHHRNPKEKDIELGKVVKRGWSRERILREINKCDVLCSNCHRKLHFEDNLPS